MSTLPPLISKARARLVVEAPFFGSIALSLRWVEDQTVGTMATDGRSILFDAAWCEAIGLRQTMGVIAHEVLHVVNKHHLRMGHRDPRLWNIATDLVINTILLGWDYALPAGGVFDRACRFTGLPAETVYARLAEDAKQQDRAPGDRPQPRGRGSGGSSASDDSAAPLGAPSWGEVRPPRPERGPSSLSAAEMAQEEARIEILLRQAVQAARRAGKLSSDLQVMVEAATPRIDWRDHFRQLVDGLRRDGLSWARPNRRYLPHGVYLPAQQRVGIGTLAVVLDSSGSISATELAAYTGEVLGLLEETQPDELILIQCDTMVQHVERLRPGEGFDRIEVKGRGGTRFQPAFDWIAEHAPEARSIVYMTDLASVDRPADPGVPVFWLTPARHKTMPFGEIVPIAL